MNLKRVYIFIESGYVWGKGHTDEQSATFEKEIKSILSSLGFGNWYKSMRCSAWECFRGENESLYCHPMDLVGLIDIDTLPEIEERIKQSEVIKFSRTTIYEPKEDDFIRHNKKLKASKEIISR